MRYNKFVGTATLAAMAVLISVLLTTATELPPTDNASRIKHEVAAIDSANKMPTLFDFDAYKRLFKKSYSGIVENMMRFKLFTSRAIRASISAIKYRFRYEKFHLAINHMSDMSPQELDMMSNKVLEREYGGSDAAQSDDLPEFIPGDDENVVATLRSLIDENAGKPEYEALRAQLEQVDLARKHQSRRKRDVELTREGPRELPLDKLVNVAPEKPDDELPAETRAKIRTKPTNKNPQYEGFELPTRGLVDQQVNLDILYFESNVPKEINMLDNMLKSLESLSQKYLVVDNDTPRKLPDEVFIDLRKSSNCFFAPRSQGKCGSCYAFATIAVAEWVHCHLTGELVALSEQYLMDCGKAYHREEKLDGCDGGFLDHASEFFYNFGWELRSMYPYMEREQQCPYAPNTDLATVGYIRTNMRNGAGFQIDTWPGVLKRIGPLAINMSTGPSFREYGSGVFDKCVPRKGTHSVVLIGHGREDGEEYWLIRNSHSVGWGEAGHIKLSKKADCIWPHYGHTWGTRDGSTHYAKSYKNPLNNGIALKTHYTQKVKNNFFA